MYSFKNDYSEGAHPRILEALVKYNMVQEEGYGVDSYTQKAISKIKEEIGNSECDIHLISGGTLTNLLAISAFLRPHEACISASTGHIANLETGAIEATGHKIITVDSIDGKLKPEIIEPVVTGHHFEHMVKPKLVYISNPTELGAVYSKKELKELYSYCQSKGLILYADGARLGSALMVEEAQVTLGDMYDLTDAFFIGGTKIGALLGEALILKNCDLREEFRYLIKQRGALLAKGRILGIQFSELFEENLYFDLAKHANSMAGIMSEKLKAEGCIFLTESPTNQLFPIMENRVIEKLSEKYLFYTWKNIDEERSAIRLITSWATKEEVVQRFIEDYREAVK